MPAGSAVGATQPLTCFIPLIGQEQNLGIFRQEVLFTDVNLQISKPAAERDVLLGYEHLVTEQQKLVPVKGVQNLTQCFVVDRLRQIGAGDTGPQDFRQLLDQDSHDRYPLIGW